MARLAMEGFETGGGFSSIVNVSAPLSISAVTPRTGSYCLLMGFGSVMIADLPFMAAISEGYFRVGLRTHDLAARPPISLISGETHLLTIYCPDGTSLQLRSGSLSGAVLDTAPNAILPLTWACIEAYFKIDAVVGRFTLKVDGATVIDFTGNTGIVSPTFLRVGTSNNNNPTNARFDDLAVNDTTGARNNSWVGTGGIYGLLPTAAGTHTALTPSAGANWQCVDEVPSNNDTDYVQSATPGDVDTYTMADLPIAAGVVTAVNLCIRARKATAGDGGFDPVLRHGGVDYNGTELPFDISYKANPVIYQEAPDATAWDVAKVNALEAGYEVT